jgi:transposase-like protein
VRVQVLGPADGGGLSVATPTGDRVLAWVSKGKRKTVLRLVGGSRAQTVTGYDPVSHHDASATFRKGSWGDAMEGGRGAAGLTAVWEPSTFSPGSHVVLRDGNLEGTQLHVTRQTIRNSPGVTWWVPIAAKAARALLLAPPDQAVLKRLAAQRDRKRAAWDRVSTPKAPGVVKPGAQARALAPEHGGIEPKTLHTWVDEVVTELATHGLTDELGDPLTADSVDRKDRNVLKRAMVDGAHHVLLRQPQSKEDVRRVVVGLLSGQFALTEAEVAELAVRTVSPIDLALAHTLEAGTTDLVEMLEAVRAEPPDERDPTFWRNEAGAHRNVFPFRVKRVPVSTFKLLRLSAEWAAFPPPYERMRRLYADASSALRSKVCRGPEASEAREAIAAGVRRLIQVVEGNYANTEMDALARQARSARAMARACQAGQTNLWSASGTVSTNARSGKAKPVQMRARRPNRKKTIVWGIREGVGLPLWPDEVRQILARTPRDAGFDAVVAVHPDYAAAGEGKARAEGVGARVMLWSAAGTTPAASDGDVFAAELNTYGPPNGRPVAYASANPKTGEYKLTLNDKPSELDLAMAQLVPEDATLLRQWMDTRSPDPAEMLALVQAHQRGDSAMALGVRPSTAEQLDQFARRLGLGFEAPAPPPANDRNVGVVSAAKSDALMGAFTAAVKDLAAEMSREASP